MILTLDIGSNTMKIFNVDCDQLKFQFEYNPIETQKLSNAMNKKQDITVDDLRRIALWKLDRVLEVNDETIQNLQTIANSDNIKFNSSFSKETIEMLVNSDGIGFPMASAILKFIRPDIYPIIDVRAYRALYGKKISYSQYTLSKYLDYCEKIYEISKYMNLKINEVDEQLYMFDKTHNGKI